MVLLPQYRWPAFIQESMEDSAYLLPEDNKQVFHIGPQPIAAGGSAQGDWLPFFGPAENILFRDSPGHSLRKLERKTFKVANW